ncbi:MAG: ParB/RepB/Spo0J family partition protein [Candidatus Omnitrophota bacterium]|nr:ParB/RepB/Spo0J family partition protein [Candidatus Omnitrophota bacterium]
MERKALGKGISALIPEKVDEQGDKIINLKISQIKPNPFQPRENFKPESLEELTQSIKEKGIIQPILARRRGDAYELIAGERRLRAASMLNLDTVPVIIKDVSDEDSLELALIENIQRQDLNPIEEARAYQFLIDKFQLTQERISEILGKSRASVTNTIRLLKLPHEIQEEIKKERISFAHGRAILEIEDINLQRKLAQDVISKSLSVKELENIIKAHRPRQKARFRVQVREPYLAVLEENLQQKLATKVRIVSKRKRGHIIIEYYSQEDLERIIHRIKGAENL